MLVCFSGAVVSDPEGTFMNLCPSSRARLPRRRGLGPGKFKFQPCLQFSIHSCLGDNRCRLWQGGASFSNADYVPESAAGSGSESEATALLEDVCMEILKDIQAPEAVFDSLMELSLRGPDGKLRLSLHLYLGCSE